VTDSERFLAAVLFTDVAGSTERAAELGDRVWRALLEEHHALVRRELARFGGREINTAGDGFLAAFDRPARAIRCACTIRDAVRDLGLEIRAGVHMGEVEGEGRDIGGLAVHIGARVAQLAGAGEVLVSGAVHDALAGSGFAFEDRGVRDLKGVPGEWRLFAVSRLPAGGAGELAAGAPAEVRARGESRVPGRHQWALPKVLGLYTIASLLVVGMVRLLILQLGLPDWFLPGALALLAIGLPIILTTAIVQASRGAAATADTRGSPARQPGPQRSSVLSPAPGRASDGPGGRHWLTWRRAIGGGVLAFAFWGLLAAAYMITRELGVGPAASLVAAGVLDPRERILIAEFDNHTRDSLLGVTLTEALRVDLAQSSLVTVVPPEYVRDALARMEKPAGAPLDAALAREVAQREGIKAVLTGDVGAAGSGYLLSAQLLSPGTGEALAAFRETARDSTGLVAAIDRLSDRMREKIGESLKTIRGGESLEKVTTPSLDALRKYSQAVRALDGGGDVATSVELLQEAVEIDSGFAMAWRKLGVTLGNLGQQPTRALQAFVKAYENRERLTDRERYLTLAAYASYVIRDTSKGIAAYRSLLEEHPHDTWALNNLAILYLERGDYASAIELTERALGLDSLLVYSYINLIDAQVAKGDSSGARSTLELFARRFSGKRGPLFQAATLAAARGDYDGAEAIFLEVERATADDPGLNQFVSVQISDLQRLRGRLPESEGRLRNVMATQEERGLANQVLRGAIAIGLDDALLRRNSQAGLREVDAALEKHPLAALEPLDRPYETLAAFYWAANEPGRLRSLLAEITAAPSAVAQWWAASDSLAVAGYLALAEGRPLDAATLFQARPAKPGCPICWLPLLGRAYDQASEPDSAITVYERYLNTPWLERREPDSFVLVPIHERLGELYAERGEPAKAIEHYRKVAELWEHADPDLQPRVEAARRAIRALTPIRREAG
jgi:class 3 adenylate cyclase/tetratricopeptide (TPR) repeat protein